MMSSAYADEEIDNILETFGSRLLSSSGFNGEMIDNDIRLSEQIREAIEELKNIYKSTNNKTGELDRRRFL